MVRAGIFPMFAMANPNAFQRAALVGPGSDLDEDLAAIQKIDRYPAQEYVAKGIDER
jgi:hypothetical protein